MSRSDKERIFAESRSTLECSAVRSAPNATLRVRDRSNAGNRSEISSLEIALSYPAKDIFDQLFVYTLLLPTIFISLTPALPSAASLTIAAEPPVRAVAIGLSLWRGKLIEALILREWVVNLGRRNARARVSHLICEPAFRQQGSRRRKGIFPPVDAEGGGRCVGVTPVYVDRMLRALQNAGIISIDRHMLTVNDWVALQDEGDLWSAYLHQKT